ncbi:MAG: Hsp70 family protein [Defluviitaleaceae bacterium]|nr:Hsp70 family protein [Defluviitaleaceae bacterium]
MGKISLEQHQELVLGIDFGTTNCVVSVYIDDEPQIIPIDGSNIFPTAIMFEPDLEEENKLAKVFGVQAKEAAAIYPESTVLSIKRRLGSGKKISILVDDIHHNFTPEEIAAEILSYLREKAQEYLEEELLTPCEFTGCVITVPANSTDKQRKMTKDAAILAGFDTNKTFLRLEPAAAAITYALGEDANKNLLVYDFGGGTFDACVINIEATEGAEPIISILSTYGDNDLGGDDIDKFIMDMVYEEFKKQTKGEIDLFAEDESPHIYRQKKMAVARLEQVSRQAKERLSFAKSTKITLTPFLQEPRIVNINMEITREEFENHRRINQLGDATQDFERYKGKNLRDILDITIQCIDNCVNSAGISQVDEIFLVGGSSSITLVSQKILEKFGKEPHRSKISPALSISLGAATYANLILSPTATGPKIKEKTLHPLGLEIAGRKFFEIVGAGIEIPSTGLTIESTEEFPTNFDDVTSMAIVVYEDTSPTEDKSINRNGMKRLAGTTLQGIPKAPKGTEKVKVMFTVGQDNMLKVRAVSESQGVETELLVDELY